MPEYPETSHQFRRPQGDGAIEGGEQGLDIALAPRREFLGDIRAARSGVSIRPARH